MATAAGSVLEFEVSTDIVAPPPEDGQLSASVAAAIVYLSSYEHMGKARVECAAGCTCEPRTFNGNVTRKATQQNIMLLEPTRAGGPPCLHMLMHLHVGVNDVLIGWVCMCIIVWDARGGWAGGWSVSKQQRPSTQLARTDTMASDAGKLLATSCHSRLPHARHCARRD